jgi:hypothetical protein
MVTSMRREEEDAFRHQGINCREISAGHRVGIDGNIPVGSIAKSEEEAVNPARGDSCVEF